MRPIRDAEIKPLVETMGTATLATHVRACGRVLARARAEASEGSITTGDLGSEPQFEETVGRVGAASADQAEWDPAARKAAVRKGQSVTHREARCVWQSRRRRGSLPVR